MASHSCVVTWITHCAAAFVKPPVTFWQVTGELEPTAGRVRRNPRLRVATFTQHHVDQLDWTKTPLQFLAASVKGAERAG